MYKERKEAFIIAFFAAFVPFIMGFAAFYFLGFAILTSLTVGICMSITAEATNAMVLLNLKKLKTKIGSLMMGAGIFDDLLGICLFAAIGSFFLGSSIKGEFLIMAGALSAFFIGILANNLLGRSHKYVVSFEKLSLLFIVPFFFISMGIHFSIESLSVNLLLLVLIVFIAIAGKMAGVFLTKPFTKLSFKQAYLIGWGMNSRGAVELVICFIAFKVGMLNMGLYSNLVVMALITTLLFPFFVRSIIKKNPKIMN
jgi:Kef-type K+ transport system membrane component KefB